MRRTLTPAEFVLCTRIRGRQLGGFKFVRQERSIDTTSTSFVASSLIIELDGGQHAQRPRDNQRDSESRTLGYRVIRIWNNDVIENVDGVLEMLLSELATQPLTPTQPSPRKRGEGDKSQG